MSWHINNVMSPILITGSHRSGLSFVAGVFYACGAYGGKVADRIRGCARGYENNEITANIVAPYLRFLGADELCQGGLPEVAGLRPLSGLKHRVEMVMRWQGWQEKTPWFYKHPSLCLTWPTWHRAFPQARWVLVRRNPDEVVASCLATGWMKGRTNEAEWRQWLAHYNDRMDEIVMASRSAIEVWPRAKEVIENHNYSGLKDAVEKAGLRWNAGAVQDFVDRQRRS